MHMKLSIPKRLKDLQVVDKHLALEQLVEQTGLSKSALSKYEGDDYKDRSGRISFAKRQRDMVCRCLVE